MVFTSGHTTFPPHYHHRDPRVTVTVWRKTPSLQLLVLTRVFITLFIGEHLLYTATCFTSLVRVAATSCGHMFPPHTCVPRVAVRTVGVPVSAPVRFPVANPRAPPPTTIQDRVCPDTDVGVAPCVCGKSRNHGRCNRRGGNRNPRSTPHVMAMWSRTRCGAEDWNRQSLILRLQICSFTLFGDFIFVDLTAVEVRRESSIAPRAKLSSISRYRANHFQSPWNQLIVIGLKTAPGISAIGERPGAFGNQSQTFKNFSVVWYSSSFSFDAVGLCMSFVYSCILTL